MNQTVGGSIKGSGCGTAAGCGYAEVKLFGESGDQVLNCFGFMKFHSSGQEIILKFFEHSRRWFVGGVEGIGPAGRKKGPENRGRQGFPGRQEKAAGSTGWLAGPAAGSFKIGGRRGSE